MPAEADQAFVTLATTDGYGMGAVVVGKSLRRHGTAGRLVVMVTPNISPGARLSLESVFDEVVQVDVLDSADRAHLAWLGRPELGVTLTKLHCWSLTHYHKCVFLDADTLVLTNVDELFEREELSAAPDPGWPDCFNSGVFVFRPSLDTHRRLLEHAARHGSFDGGDQGLLNSFFSDWSMTNISKHLPFLYNVSASALYTHLPAFHQYGRHAKIVHFLGGAKPWHFRYSPSTNESHAGDPITNLDQYVSRWWEEYLRDVEPHVTKADVHQSSGPAPAPAEPRREKRRTKEPIPRVGTVADRTTVSLRQLTLSPPTTLHPDDTKLRRERTEQQAIIFAEHPQPQDMTGSEAGHSEWEELYDPPSGQGGGASGEEAAGGSTSPPGDTSSEPAPTESEEEKAERRRKWEEGDVDYMGKDAFDNIKKKLDRFLD